jgi:hypothetical protein
MLPRETTNIRGIKLDGMKVTINSTAIASFGSYVEGEDTVLIMGFIPSMNEDLSAGDTEDIYEITPVGELSSFLGSIVGDLSNEQAVESFKQSDIYKAVVSCRKNGAQNIAVLKMGSTQMLESVSITDDEHYDFLYERLFTALPIAVTLDDIDYLVPLDIPAEGYTRDDGTHLDFMSLCADACFDSAKTGHIIQCVMSTMSNSSTIWMNSESIKAKEAWQLTYCYSPIKNKWVPDNDKYRFVAVPTGRALFSYQDHSLSFEQGLAPALAGKLASLKDNMSVMGRTLSCYRPMTPVLGSTADNLSIVGFMPTGQTAMMRRKKEFGTVVLNDSTMAIPGSDFRQEVVLRLARRVGSRIRRSLEPIIGTSGSTVSEIVNRIMGKMVTDKMIRSYTYESILDPRDPGKLLIKIQVEPFLPIKAIEISIVAGPFVR